MFKTGQQSLSTGSASSMCFRLYRSEDGKRNLADITRLIDKVYISKLALCCPENGNIDGDELDKVNLADITGLIDHVYISKAETAACE